MRLDYLENTNQDHPEDMLLRLFDFDELESRRLVDAIREMLSVPKRTSIHDLDFVRSDHCRLFFEIGLRDVGIERISKAEFVCRLAAESFRTMIELIEPFTERLTPGHYQWLSNLTNPIDLLLSPTGDW